MPSRHGSPIYRSEARAIDLHDASGNARVVLDVRGLTTLGGQLAIEAGSNTSGLVIQFRGRAAYLEPAAFGPGDDRGGSPYIEIDPAVRLMGAGCTQRNIDVTRYAQVEAIVTTPAGAPATGRLALHGEGRAHA